MTKVNHQNIHREFVLQEHFIGNLVSEEGYIRRVGSEHSRDYAGTTDYDKSLAMDRELVVTFIKKTQPQTWQALEGRFKGTSEKHLFQNLEREIKSRGLLDVLRNGIKLVPNIHIKMCFFRPASKLEPNRVNEWEGNILSVMDEVEYSVKSGNRIDMVLFVNGLPVVTIEAKNEQTGSNFTDAEKQYCDSRPPAGEPLLTFNRGAMVHFALDGNQASMTTRLQNSKTEFLPFNRGNEGGKGNPSVDDEFSTAYFYRSGEWGNAIFSRSVLIDIIGKFAHLEIEDKHKKLIFPRFHQLDSVRRILAHAREHGPGNNYLIQHSAGSGKSNTIGWLAHQAINLHNQNDEPIFNTAIIVTNRLVLDRQLQSTVSQFEQTAGLVKRIDGTSRQLKEAISTRARIIVTTIQKFSTEHLQKISGQGQRTFAVIVDEAHSGQSGKSTASMTETLTREDRSSEEIEDLIAEYQRARGPQSNISFFAFTATPRNVTLEKFGSPGEDDKPQAFHLYSMRQAIEEGFILDVLQNYTTYQSYYKLEKAIKDDPKLSRRKGARTVARHARLHTVAIGQKVEIVVEHFRRHVMGELDGQEKAMVVTESRRHAYDYYKEINKYIREQGYSELKALVAFSGNLQLEDGIETSEAQLNGFSEAELRFRFDGSTEDGTPYDEIFAILIVAEKYQTGYDQPKLCAMYIDRELEGLQVVQTLSRLNRIYPKKTATYILDFRNTVKDVQDAFKPYYEATSIENVSNPNLIYALEARLFAFGYLDREEIDEFAEELFTNSLNVASRPVLDQITKEAITRFNMDTDEKQRDEFRQTVKSFTRFYTFISQIVALEDPNLEKLYGFCVYISRALVGRHTDDLRNITEEMLNLTAFSIKKQSDGSASLEAGDTDELGPISVFGVNPYTEDEEKELSEIVKSFNEHHGTDFTKEDFIRLEKVNEEVLSDEQIKEMLRKNPEDVVYPAFKEKFLKVLIDTLRRQQALKDAILSDTERRDRLIRHILRRAMREIQESN